MYFSFSTLTLCVALLSQAVFVASAPLFSRASTGSGSGSPRFVIYTDQSVKSATGLPAPGDLKGYTHLLLAFLLPEGPADQSKVWSSLDAGKRKTLKAQYAAAGIKVMVSAFGETSHPTTEGKDPAKTATTMANFVKANNLDGIDVDYEDLEAVGKGTAVAWLTTFTTTLRKALPSPQFTISHAPLAPHFSPSFPSTPAGAQGPYLQIDKKVGKLIDFYNVQFYNQNKDYTTCGGLLTKSSSIFPKSSLFEISASGVPLNKLVIGKPIAQKDAGSGFMSATLISQCVQQAVAKKWNAGIMGFQFSGAAGAASFIKPSLAKLGGGSKRSIGGVDKTTTTSTAPHRL